MKGFDKQEDLSSILALYENSWAWWRMLIIPELGRKRQEDPWDLMVTWSSWWLSGQWETLPQKKKKEKRKAKEKRNKNQDELLLRNTI